MRVARGCSGATPVELSTAILLLVVCMLIIELVEARARSAQHLLMIMLRRYIVVLQRRRTLAVFTQRRLTRVQGARLVASICLRQLLVLATCGHIKVV